MPQTTRNRRKNVAATDHVWKYRFKWGSFTSRRSVAQGRYRTREFLSKHSNADKNVRKLDSIGPWNTSSPEYRNVADEFASGKTPQSCPRCVSHGFLGHDTCGVLTPNLWVPVLLLVQLWEDYYLAVELQTIEKILNAAFEWRHERV